MLTFNFRDFDRMAREVENFAQDQMPFAISKAINAAAENTRVRLADETWPQHVQVRNRGFLKAALRVKNSTKRDLKVTIFDKLERANLTGHAKGNTKQAKSGALAIPQAEVKRTARGVSGRMKPRNLPNSFRRGDAIFQRIGKGKRERLRLMYILKPSVSQPKDVPFYEDFHRFMREEIRSTFPAAMKQAMQTRRKR